MTSLNYTSKDLELLPDKTDPLESPLLPGFRCQINQLFDEIEPLAH